MKLTPIKFIVSLSLLTASMGIAQPPNILLIMADDLGAENLACYGNTAYATPNLDRMATEGALFDHAYATPVCTPTRAMILTGLYPNRSGFLERLDSPDDPEQSNRLPVRLKTFGDVFQSAGYATAIAGKWHLGDFQRYPDQPTSHGFDEHCLWVQNWDGERPSRYYGPHHWENGKHVVHDEKVFGPDFHGEFLMEFMAKNREQPFLAYFPMNLIHTPLVTPPGDMTPAEVNYPEDLGTKERTVGHMVYHMDKVVGQLIEKLEELGLTDNTIVIFTGDNGTGGNLTSRLGDFHLKGGKRTMNEAGTRVPFIAKWPGKIPAGRIDSMITLMDVLPTLASMAGISMEHDVDGMDLSHNLLGTEGEDRNSYAMAFEGEVYFVRDQRFRLHEDGRFYDVPTTSNESRYSMELVEDSNAHSESRERLQKDLEAFMKIRKTDDSYTIIPFGTNGDNFKNAQEKQSKKPN